MAKLSEEQKEALHRALTLKEEANVHFRSNQLSHVPYQPVASNACQGCTYYPRSLCR